MLLAVGFIVLVDVCITAPLITLSLLGDDITLSINKEKTPNLNVR